MNKTLKSNLFKYFSAAAALIIALPVTARAIPLKEKYKAAAPTYETTESDVLDTPRYASLVAEYEKNGYKNAVTEVAVDSVVPVLNDGKKSVAVDDEKEGTVFKWGNKEDEATWTFNTRDAGLYNIKFRYLLGNDGMAAVRSLKIDGSQVCLETNKVNFYGLSRDDLSGGIRKNSLGDEVRPKQENLLIWQDMYISDAIGVEAMPLSFYFSSGAHTVTLTYISGEINISAACLTPPAQLKTYGEYVKSNPDAPVTDTVKTIEAEEMLYKSHTTIRMESSYDPSCSPRSITSVTMNTMGGSMWSKVGQTAYWQIDAPEDGYYNLAFHVRQDFSQGMPVYRKIMIDNAVPFKDLSEYRFDYSTKWYTEKLSDKNGGLYKIYLTKGKHVLSMTPVIGEMGNLMNAVNDCTQLLSDFMLQVMMITTSDPDLNYDYELDKKIPTINETINRLYDYQIYCIDALNSLAQKRSSLTNNFNQLAEILELLKKDPENTIRKLTEMQNLLSTLSTTYISLQSQPLTVDTVSYGNCEKVKKPTSSFFVRLYSVFANVVLSFTKDYDNVKMEGDYSGAAETLSVWCGEGSEWAQIIKQLTDENFTSKEGIAIDMNILPSSQLATGSVNALMLAIASGTAPDVAIGVSASSAGEFAMRDTVVDLSKQDGYESVAEQLVPGSVISQTFEDGVYGIPLTAGFKVMFYRKDIFRNFGFTLPETWDDVYNTLLPMLYQNNLQMYIPNDFGMFLAQYGGKYYTDDYTASALDTNEAYQAFKAATELYTNYGIDVSASFYNRFRSGEMPIGIGGFSEYMSLQVAAPELTGKWGITLIPGVKKENGDIDRSYMTVTSTTGIILSKCRNVDAAWKFLKWFISEDTQYQYDILVEASIGQDSRVATANFDALLRLPWDSNDIEVIKESFKWATDTPAVLGGYFTSRHISNAWNRVVMSSKPLRSSLEQAVEDINEEISAKRKEYGRK